MRKYFTDQTLFSLYFFTGLIVALVFGNFFGAVLWVMGWTGGMDWQKARINGR